jgi:hypothetical protein
MTALPVSSTRPARGNPSCLRDDLIRGEAVLPVAEGTVLLVSGLLAAERRRRGTRGRRRALGCYRQAVLVLRWFCDGTRLAQLVADKPDRPVHGLSISARGHRRARRGGARVARGTVGRRK